jgi:hypothetical protein
LLPAIGPIELFIRDSLHSERGRRFELDHASVALQPNGVMIVDAMDVNPRGRPFNRSAADSPASGPHDAATGHGVRTGDFTL